MRWCTPHTKPPARCRDSNSATCETRNKCLRVLVRTAGSATRRGGLRPASGRTQSDEASFFLQDYEALNTEAWFGKSLAKIVSISAAMMSVHFSAFIARTAVFDARAFVMPLADVPNYFVWRAQDWARNSLQMYCRAHFSHEALLNKSRVDLHNMLHAIGRNWTADLDARCRNGTFLIRAQDAIATRSDVFPNYPSIAQAMGVASTSASSGTDA